VRIVIAGGHGQIARRLARLLAARGDDVVSIVRQPAHLLDVADDGATGVLLDLEDATVAQVAEVVAAADATVFAAGAGPGSGSARKDTVDRGASVLLADAAETAGVPRLVQISSMGTDRVAGGAEPTGMDDVFVAYLRAKAAAEDDLRKRDGLRWTILRPGRLTDDSGTGLVSLATSLAFDSVARDDVAAVVAAMLVSDTTAGLTLELTGGTTPIAEAVAAADAPTQET
jgi:nucleoside-diphosphate-sugar epimerase